jgi:excisionase family DNA binding protein
MNSRAYLSQQSKRTRHSSPILEEPGSLESFGFVSVTEAAAFLRLGISTVYAMIDKGLIPHAQFGRSKRVPKRFLLDAESEALNRGE